MPRDCPYCGPSVEESSETLVLPGDWTPFDDAIARAIATPEADFGISNPEVAPSAALAVAPSSGFEALHAYEAVTSSPVAHDASVVPEPSTAILLAIGLCGLTSIRPRRRQAGSKDRSVRVRD